MRASLEVNLARLFGDAGWPSNWSTDHPSLEMSDKVCPYCKGPLMKIDHYGEVLVGCIDCNRWGHPGDDKLIMELMESDLEALRESGGG